MKNLFFTALLIFVAQLIFSQTIHLTSISSNAKYGYTAKKAIKVGTIANEYVYLAALRGANGENITYKREGTCCAFKTKNSPFGTGLIDVWVITFPDGKESKIYINGYDYANPMAPKGFSIKRDIEPLSQ